MPQTSRPGFGDQTGQLKAKAAKEQGNELRERSAEVSMATATEVEEIEHGVFDPQSGARVDVPQAVFAEPQAMPTTFPEDEEPTFSGRESFDEVETATAGRRRIEARPFKVAQSPFVTVRIDQDIEDMTYGMKSSGGEPNNYSFREGVKYKVPREVAEHLDERGLIRQWITS